MRVARSIELSGEERQRLLKLAWSSTVSVWMARRA
jgi:hypothetical protein